MIHVPALSRQSRNTAVAVVLFSAAMWAFWWLPVRMIEANGPTGAWTGVVMSAAALLLCLPLLALTPGQVSARGVVGALLVGVAVTGYTISVSYTDFLRAVLIFYIAPSWSLMIECFFLGRRWTLRALASIVGSFIGLALISRGEVSFEGVGAIGDWMALIAGIAWSAGAACVFTARAAGFGWTMVMTLVGSIAVGLALLGAMGEVMGSAPTGVLLNSDGLLACVFGGLFLALILGCTMWGATRLPPTILSFLLSVEIICGVAVSALILGERFGLFEFAGSAFIIGAVLLELTGKQDRQDG